MKVFDQTQAAGVFRRNDIQIQSPAAKLGIAIVGANDAKIRIRHISPSGGTKVIQDLVSLRTLLEADTFSEGFFMKSDTSVSGTFSLSEHGGLDLRDGYLSLDIDCENVATITSLMVHAIEAPSTSNRYLAYNPVYMNGGITREISLSGVKYIVLPIKAIKTVDIDYVGRSVSYDAVELGYIAKDINDLVSVATQGEQLPAAGLETATAVIAGFETLIRLDAHEAARMTITPTDATPFYVHLVEERVL